MHVLNGTNNVYPMNGYTNRVQPMNGRTSRVRPINGTNNVFPMNGTNQVIPMQGLKGTYYVSPLSIMDITDVPDNWFPKNLSPDDILLLKTAYIMGDQRALNGFWSNIIKASNKVASGISNVVGDVYTGIAYSNRPEEKEIAREALDQVRRDTYDKVAGVTSEVEKYDSSTASSAMSDADRVGGALDSAGSGGVRRINWDDIGTAAREAVDRAETLAREKAQEFLNEQLADQAANLANQAATALTNAGIVPDPVVLADKAVTAVNEGYQKGGGGVKQYTAPGGLFNKISDWWKGAGTGEKVLAGAGVAAGLYGLGKYVVIPLIKPKKGRIK